MVFFLFFFAGNSPNKGRCCPKGEHGGAGVAPVPPPVRVSVGAGGLRGGFLPRGSEGKVAANGWDQIVWKKPQNSSREPLQVIGVAVMVGGKKDFPAPLRSQAPGTHREPGRGILWGNLVFSKQDLGSRGSCVGSAAQAPVQRSSASGWLWP